MCVAAVAATVMATASETIDSWPKSTFLAMY